MLLIEHYIYPCRRSVNYKLNVQARKNCAPAVVIFSLALFMLTREQNSLPSQDALDSKELRPVISLAM
jgi:hypothetical protein